MSYRASRNLEASVFSFIEDNLSTDWSNVNIIKGFQKAYETTLPVVAIRLGDTTYKKVEIGDNDYMREAVMYVEVMGSSQGQVSDLKDYLIELLKDGCIYYEFTITDGEVSAQVANGRIRISEMRDTPIRFDSDRSSLDIHDRFRYQIRLTVSTGQVE